MSNFECGAEHKGRFRKFHGDINVKPQDNEGDVVRMVLEFVSAEFREGWKYIHIRDCYGGQIISREDME